VILGRNTCSITVKVYVYPRIIFYSVYFLRAHYQCEKHGPIEKITRYPPPWATKTLSSLSISLLQNRRRHSWGWSPRPSPLLEQMPAFPLLGVAGGVLSTGIASTRQCWDCALGFCRTKCSDRSISLRDISIYVSSYERCFHRLGGCNMFW
jgi:hypothetical protein